MAYSALVSLKRTLLLYSADPSSIHLNCEKHEVESFLENLDFLRYQFLDKMNHESSTVALLLEKRIRDAVYEAQDIVDIHFISGDSSTEPIEEGNKDREYVLKLKNPDLKTVIREIDSVKQEIHLINKEESLTVTPPVPDDAHSWSSFRAKFGSDSKNLMVGFDDLTLQIKDQLGGESSSSLQVISLVGMGGIGKTTLAINTYNDPYTVAQFDIRGWVTVSQSYSGRSIFLELLDSMKQLTPKMRQDSDDEIACHLHKTLKEKRYLVVIDDIWDTDAWDLVRRMLPNDDNGSRIMLTTRITDVAAYAATSSDHISPMPLLSDDISWILLSAKVFGSKFNHLLDLEEIGKDIARKCRGLPLSITVIGGLLSKVDMTYESWLAVAKNINSMLSSIDDPSSGILRMSYNYLPQHLKSCFLYFGIFPEDHEIDVTKLVNLWIAEGFLDGVCCSESVEEVAEKWLGELIDRSLLSTSKMKPNGKMKSCKIHDLLLDICAQESDREKILQIKKCYDSNLFQNISTHQRRLSIHQTGGSRYINRPPGSNSLARSLICTGKYDFMPGVFVRFKLLRVLDLIKVAFDKFPEEVTSLVQLRYLAFLYRGIIPSSLSNLPYLQTIMFQDALKLPWSYGASFLPSEIWKMKHLRHIQFAVGSLKVDNYLARDDDNDLVLEEVHTFIGLRDLIFTEELIRRIPNIRKLMVRYQSFGPRRYEFQNLAKLHRLKELKLKIDNQNLIVVPDSKFEFPKSLETLSLYGTEIPWEYLSSRVGSLPHLRVLKLKFKACVGEEWVLKEGEFCELKVLKLSGLRLKVWEADAQHFPRLEHLSIGNCHELGRIPVGLGESCTFNKIELWDVLRRNDGIVSSANEIKAIQHDLGNEDFQVVEHKMGWPGLST